MKKDMPLKVNMLGEFSIEYNGKVISDKEGRSKKLWLFIEYLVTFRGREISQNDLIDLLWPDEKNGNPANTLKTLVHRARTLIDTLGFSNAKDMIIYRRGTYAWNSAVDMVVDLDIFELHVKEAEKEGITVEHKLHELMTAIEMYKGDFLPRLSLESWAVPISTYYHTMYIKAVNTVIDILAGIKDWEAIIGITQKAIEIDPYDEKLHYHLIQALVNTKNQQIAKNHYESVKKMFFERFGVALSDEFNSLYKKVIRTVHQTEGNIEVIRDALSEQEHDSGAFYCEYEVFKEIYQLEVRNSARTGQTMFLALVSVTDPSGKPLSQRQMSGAMSKLLLTVNESLRRGDVYTRYSPSQYLMMLQMLTFENAQMVTDRIVKRFKREYPKLAVKVNADILPIEILF